MAFKNVLLMSASFTAFTTIRSVSATRTASCFFVHTSSMLMSGASCFISVVSKASDLIYVIHFQFELLFHALGNGLRFLYDVDYQTKQCQAFFALP